MTIKKPDPNRTYIAMCNKANFDGYYFKKFTLPDSEKNTVNHAGWYFLNIVDGVACLERTISWEDFSAGLTY
jgi:hypothetical protein